MAKSNLSPEQIEQLLKCWKEGVSVGAARKRTKISYDRARACFMDFRRKSIPRGAPKHDRRHYGRPPEKYYGPELIGKAMSEAEQVEFRICNPYTD
jgi:hypothetical protein